jgi:Holliday junction resolvasome RuvABC endonuclease subunit
MPRSDKAWDLKNLKVMGLDLSLTSPGIAVTRGGELVESLSIKTTTDDSWFVRINTVATNIVDKAVQHDPDFIFIENYSFNSKFGRELAGEVHGVVLHQLFSHGYDNIFRTISPTQLKTYTTGDSKATKKAMIQGVLDSYGVKFKQSQNDQADAFALAKMAEKLVQIECGLTFILPKHQKVALEKAQETLRSDAKWLKMLNQK